MTENYQLTLYSRSGLAIFTASFHWLQTAKDVARDNLHEYGAETAIITKPRGTKISRCLGGSWQNLE